MSANSERELKLVPPGYPLVATRTRLLAARLLEEVSPDPEHVTAERRAALDDAVAKRYPRRAVAPPPDEGDDMTRDRLRRLMPGRTPKEPRP